MTRALVLLSVLTLHAAAHAREECRICIGTECKPMPCWAWSSKETRVVRAPYYYPEAFTVVLPSPYAEDWSGKPIRIPSDGGVR